MPWRMPFALVAESPCHSICMREESEAWPDRRQSSMHESRTWMNMIAAHKPSAATASLFGLGRGKTEGEGGSLPDAARKGQCRSVALCDVPHDAQTQAGAAGAARLVHPVKALEDTIPMLGVRMPAPSSPTEPPLHHLLLQAPSLRLRLAPSTLATHRRQVDCSGRRCGQNSEVGSPAADGRRVWTRRLGVDLDASPSLDRQSQ